LLVSAVSSVVISQLLVRGRRHRRYQPVILPATGCCALYYAAFVPGLERAGTSLPGLDAENIVAVERTGTG